MLARADVEVGATVTEPTKLVAVTTAYLLLC
jgi:hypothetical protein